MNTDSDPSSNPNSRSDSALASSGDKVEVGGKTDAEGGIARPGNSPSQKSNHSRASGSTVSAVCNMP